MYSSYWETYTIPTRISLDNSTKFTKHLCTLQGSDILSITLPLVMGFGALIVPTVLMLVLALALFRYVLHAHLSSSVVTNGIGNHLHRHGSLVSAHSASSARRELMLETLRVWETEIKEYLEIKCVWLNLKWIYEYCTYMYILYE